MVPRGVHVERLGRHDHVVPRVFCVVAHVHRQKRLGRVVGRPHVGLEADRRGPRLEAAVDARALCYIPGLLRWVAVGCGGLRWGRGAGQRGGIVQVSEGRRRRGEVEGGSDLRKRGALEHSQGRAWHGRRPRPRGLWTVGTVAINTSGRQRGARKRCPGRGRVRVAACTHHVASADLEVPGNAHDWPLEAFVHAKRLRRQTGGWGVGQGR